MIDRDGDPRHAIGETARILGVSQRSLRYYEAEGLISPQVDSGSGYRYYTVRDVCQFREYQDLRGMGFSLEAARALMLDADFEMKATALEARESELEREIGRLRFLIGWSRENRRRCREVRSEVGRLELSTRPALIRFEYEYDRRFSAPERDKAVIKSLQDASPAVFTSVRIAEAAVGNAALRCVFHRGLAFWEKDAALVSADASPPLVRVPEHAAVHLIARTVGECRSEWFEDVIAFCADRKLGVCGDIHGAFYIGSRFGAERERYYEFWVPVRPVL